MNDMNRDQLRKVAQARGIAGRSKMTVEELRKAVRIAVQSAPSPLTNTARISNYRRQNGPNRITARQARRIRHAEYTSAGF